MLNPHELQELGRERQRALIERGQQNARAREIESRRRRALIAAGKNQRRSDQLSPLEPTVITILGRVITAIIGKIESLVPARPAVLTGAFRIRRGIR